MSSRDLGVEQWIETHTIECIPYAARLSPRQCGLQQTRGDRTFCPCAQAAAVRPMTANGERRALLRRAIDKLGLEQVARVLGNQPNTVVGVANGSNPHDGALLARVAQRFNLDGTARAATLPATGKKRGRPACAPMEADERQQAMRMLLAAVAELGIDEVAHRLRRCPAVVRGIARGWYPSRPDAVLHRVLAEFGEEARRVG